MTDLETWKLRGRVRTLRSEVAGWDVAAREWSPPRFFNASTFDAEGRLTELDQRGVGNAVCRATYVYDDNGRLREVRSGTAGEPVQVTRSYAYDERGRLLRITEAKPGGTETILETSTYASDGSKTKVEFVPADLGNTHFGFGIEGSDIAYGAPGATTVTTTYDERGRPVEGVFHGSTHALLRRVTFTRDREGRVLREEARGDPPFDVGTLGAMSADDRTTLLALLADAFGSIETTYAYDAKGRVLQRTERMGKLGERQTTFAYDDHDNVSEERTADRHREMRANDDGSVSATPDVVTMHDARYEYTYDAAGNWTERIVSARFEPHAEFVRSNVERRSITYYDR